MSTEQATWDDINEFVPVDPKPATDATLFERVTGQRSVVNEQQVDGDRVSDEEPPQLEDGLEDAVDGDVEVQYR